jgi:ribosome-associated protein
LCPGPWRSTSGRTASTLAPREGARRRLPRAGAWRRETAIRPYDLARKARKILNEKKGANIRLLDVRKRSEVTDYYLVVSGNSPPHLKAMFSEVQRVLKDEGVHCYRRSGDPDCGWLVLDYVDVIIHMFLPDAREYYAIEELWAHSPPAE